MATPLAFFFFFLMIRPPPRSTLFPYTTPFRSSPKLPLLKELSEPVAYTSAFAAVRSENHTSELQSRPHPVCPFPLVKKALRLLASPPQVCPSDAVPSRD